MAIKAVPIHPRHSLLVRLRIGVQRRADQGDLPERRHCRRYVARGHHQGRPDTESAEEDAMTRTLAEQIVETLASGERICGDR